MLRRSHRPATTQPSKATQKGTRAKLITRTQNDCAIIVVVLTTLMMMAMIIAIVSIKIIIAVIIMDVILLYPPYLRIGVTFSWHLPAYLLY